METSSMSFKMSKPRLCPNCKTPVPIGFGYFFDKENNMICEGCNKVVFPTTTAAENQMDKPVQHSYKTSVQHSHSYPHQHHKTYNHDHHRSGYEED
jgi:hypothetical protein